MLTCVTRPFEPDDARLYVALAADAFSIVPAWQRPKDSVEFVANLHSAANPAGRALVSIARLDGREVGHFSALPARLLRPDGTIAVGWQLSCFAIARGLQRQGVGTQLVASLLDEVAKRPDDFVYVYPNPRSLGVFVRHGGRYLDDAPSWIVAPSPSKSVRGRGGDPARIELVDAHAAGAIAARVPEIATTPGAFVKDRAFFAWRFLGPDADRRTRFAHVAVDGEEFVIVLSSHRAKGVTFTVLVDVFPDVFATRFGLVLRAARAAGGGRPVYLTTNLNDRVDTSGAPWRVRVPTRFDPRPVGTMILPRTTLPDDDLRRAPVITGDWMSF